MSERTEIQRLLNDLYTARMSGDLAGLCRLFSPDAKFRIAGASRHATPIAIAAVGIDEIRQWLSLLLKTFQLTDRTALATVIDPPKAAVHWQVKVYSRITGLTMPTELVDLVELRAGAIAGYTEFLMPH